ELLADRETLPSAQAMWDVLNDRNEKWIGDRPGGLFVPGSQPEASYDDDHDGDGDHGDRVLTDVEAETAWDAMWRNGRTDEEIEAEYLASTKLCLCCEERVELDADFCEHCWFDFPDPRQAKRIARRKRTLKEWIEVHKHQWRMLRDMRK